MEILNADIWGELEELMIGVVMAELGREGPEAAGVAGDRSRE